MQSQKSIEEIEIIRSEMAYDWRKTHAFSSSVIGRYRLRGMRFLMFALNIPFPIPFNSANVTHSYCEKYFGPEDDSWKNDPAVLMGASSD